MHNKQRWRAWQQLNKGLTKTSKRGAAPMLLQLLTSASVSFSFHWLSEVLLSS